MVLYNEENGCRGNRMKMRRGERGITKENKGDRTNWYKSCGERTKEEEVRNIKRDEEV